jgi:hypothetical protein
MPLLCIPSKSNPLAASDNELMRKRVLDLASLHTDSEDRQEWFNLEEIAIIEVTSEATGYPIESAFAFGAGPGWRAASPGKQRVRLVFDGPLSIKRIRLQFNEPEVARTQEFQMQWSSGGSDAFKEVVRQQWNFSPRGSQIEAEDYQVELTGVSILELIIKPDLDTNEAVATLGYWRLA